MILDDQQLTTKGLAIDNPDGRVLLIACGALAHEIIALKKLNGWDHLDITCLPAILHNHPERIPGAVEQAVNAYRAEYDKVFVVYADCGTGGMLQKTCDRLGVQMIEGPHCYSFFQGKQNFAACSESDFTAFYLTDFLVRQFDAFVWTSLGLDRYPELRDMYFGNYEKLVYLAQVDDRELIEKARKCADRLGLDFEHRFTGYGGLEVALSAL